MDKLGKVLVPTSKPILETNSTLTGDGINTPLGLNYTAWKFNTDELLWSGGPQSSIRVNKPLNLYERVMFRLGHSGYGKQFEEYSTNTTEFYLNPMFAKDSANSEVWFETNGWRFGDTKRDLVWQGHCYRRNLKAGGGVFEDLSADIEGYEDEKYPISEVWGVNRIDFNIFNVYLDYSEGGILTSDKSSGYNGEICTLISIPESEVWKCSAIDITGATLTGNDFMFSNSNVTASAGFEHSRELTIEPTAGGVITANLNSGFSGDVITLGVDSTNEGYKFSSYNVTGSEATGNDIMFTGSDITAQGNFEHYKDLTLENGEHGVLSADKMTGFSGDVVTVDATTDEGWYLSAIALTGAEATGFKFMFTGSDVTALGEYTDVGFPITYLSDEHVSVTGDTTIFIPGSEGITLDSGYDDYYRISGYDITNGSIIDGKLVPTGPCTIKAVETLNYFTATGNFEQGSNVNVTAGSTAAKSTNVPAKYALYVGHTGDIPASWYETSNRWKPNSASAYSITLNTKMSFSISGSNTIYSNTKGELTAGSLIGSTLTQTAVSSRASKGIGYYYYNKTFTSTAQNVNYGVSAKLYAVGYYYYHPDVGKMQTKFDTKYYSSGTNGTWTATGIAP